MPDLVSIITPAYKCEKTIENTYNSVKSQTFSDWEWIIVEDRSPDNSYLFIKKMIENDPRVILLQTEKNSGAAVARNVGIQNAKGKYIAFLDADDLWKKDKLEKQVSFMKKNDYAFSYTDYDVFYPSGETKEFKTKKDKENYKSLLKSNGIGCLTAMYDAEKLGKVLMPLDCEKREDHGMWLDITKNGTVAYKLCESLAIYRVDAGSVSSKKFQMAKYQYRLYRKHEKFGVVKSLWYLFLCTINKILLKY